MNESSLPEEQLKKVSLAKDFASRPLRYLKDMARCPAVLFSAGNVVYAVFLGAVADVEVGAAGAFVIQGSVAAFTASRQIHATYKGKDFGAPFRFQAYANWATAAILVTSGAAAGPKKLSMTVLPACTLALWGKAHWDVANYLDRLLRLQKEGKTPDEINADPRLRKFEKLYMAEYGVADIMAPFKNKPIDQIADTLATLVTTPAFLTAGQAASLIPLPFFLAGLSKTFFKKTPIVKNPNNANSAGYAAGALVAAVGGDPLFAGAQALWAAAYRSLATSEKREKPISADDYAKRQTAAQKKTISPTPPQL